MGFKRPHAKPSGSSSSSTLRHRLKRQKLADSTLLEDLNMFLIEAKIDQSTFAALYGIAEDAGATLVGSAEEADIVVTAVRMRARIERHAKWAVLKQKIVVTPDWLRDSVDAGEVKPYSDYPALSFEDDAEQASSPNGSQELSSIKPQQLLVSPTGVILVESQQPSAPNVANNYKAHYCCERLSPMRCPNQRLAEELDVIQQSRLYESEHRSHLSYQRAIATVKAYPRLITSMAQVKGLPYLGEKISAMVEEYIDTGHISAAREIATSQRFQVLKVLNTVYGIGPVVARTLYDGRGIRSIDDLKKYYDIWDDEEEEDPDVVPGALQLTSDAFVEKEGGLLPDGGVQVAKDYDADTDGDSVVTQDRPGGEQELDGQHPEPSQNPGSPPPGVFLENEETGIRASLRIYDDLLVKIPRSEVEEIARVISAELEEIQPGCLYTIVGGYRRGKSESGDVDIVFTHPTPVKDRGLNKKLVQRLADKGMITHVMHLSSFRSPKSIPRPNWDTLEKALTVFRLPPSSPFWRPTTLKSHQSKGGKEFGIHRRVDLIFAPIDVYWCAVIGWTGSMMFERDIRKWAKDKRGWKFDSTGMTRRSDSSPILVKSEMEVFELLGLPWIEPEMRNADL